MGIEQWHHLMAQTVTVEPRTAVDSYGDATYGTATAYKCRVSGKLKMVRDSAGQERVCTHTVYIGADAEVRPADRVTLSTDYEPRQPPILAVERVMDGNGHHHTVIRLS